MKYIDADLLRKDIEFAKSVYDNSKRVVQGVADAFRQDGRAAMCDDILAVIDAMEKDQQEQQEEPDKSLEEAADEMAIRAFPEKKSYSTVYDRVVDYNAIDRKNYRDGIIAGAEWQKGQMLKDAVEATVMDFSSNQPRPQIDVRLDPHKYHTGDKVRIVVLKEEE